MTGSRRSLLFLGITAFGVVLALVAARTGGARSWQLVVSHSVIHLWLLTWLAVVSLPFRSVGTGGVAKAWLAGFFPVVLVVLAIGGVLDSDQGAIRAGVVPFVEEAAKAAVVVLAVLVARRRGRELLLCDVMLLGCAVGAGFSLREDMARDRIAADGFMADPWHVLFPTTLDIGRGMLLTHALWSLLVGLGVGAVLLRTGWVRIAGAALCAVAVIDHVSANTLGDGGIAATVTADGVVPAGILVVAVVGALVLDGRVLRAFGALDDRYRPTSVREVSRLRRWPAAAATFGFTRLRNAGLAAAARHVRDSSVPAPDPTLVHELDRLNARRDIATVT